MKSQRREWKMLLIPYEQAVEELKVKFKAVRKEFRDMNEYSPIEFVTGRVKKISSILEKCKRREIPESQIEELMEDIAGIRVMCQFIDDIYKVVDVIRQRDGKDMFIVYEKDYISSPKDSGYKSYHMIIRYPVHTCYGQRDVLAEIQIRTLAMNFWSTIEHSLNYKYQDNIPEEIHERLRKTADAVNFLDLEMCEIRNEIIKAQLMFEQKSNVVSDITSHIDSLNVPETKELAIVFQERFDAIWEDGTLEDLELLLKDIKSVLPSYKLFEKYVEKEPDETPFTGHKK